MGRRQVLGIAFVVLVLAAAFTTAARLHRPQRPPSGPITVDMSARRDNGTNVTGPAHDQCLLLATQFMDAVHSHVWKPPTADFPGRPGQGSWTMVRKRYPELQIYKSYSFGRVYSFNDGDTVDVDVSVLWPDGQRNYYYMVLIRQNGQYRVAFIT